jgi:hypothetical protein
MSRKTKRRKKMASAQYDFKSGQIIQIQYGYATYFSMVQTMVQNYSAPEKEREIITKSFASSLMQ